MNRELLAETLTEWLDTRRPSLAAREVEARLSGPFEALGMDPVFILRLVAPPCEAEVCVFEHGLLDVVWANLDTDTEPTVYGVQANDALTVSSVLDMLVLKVWPKVRPRETRGKASDAGRRASGGDGGGAVAGD